MFDLDNQLGENQLSSLAFTIIERFSTQRPLQEVLADIFNTIGSSLKVWARADEVAHVFVNPSLNESHRMICGRRKKIISASPTRNSYYEKLNEKPATPQFSPGSSNRLWEPQKKILPGDKNDILVKISLPEDIINTINAPVWICQLDFANKTPLGHFCVSWLEQPWLENSDIQKIQEVLRSFSTAVSTMLSNHFTIHKDTYFPSYYLEDHKSAALLFADIRNSTPLFEMARLGGEKHMNRVEILLKSWFEYAAGLISMNGLGCIHGFSGDGFMATFGEYAIGTDECPADHIACVLALNAAKYLIKGFDNLYEAWRTHKNVKKFYLEYNEDVRLALGVGINYGQVYFCYFGTSCFPIINCKHKKSTTFLPSGHLEYTAIGDHVNTAERIEGIASKLAKEVNLQARGEKFENNFYISPIVVSQTVSHRLMKILNESENDILKRRGVALLKGKGSRLPFFEVEPKDINEITCANTLLAIHSQHYHDCLKQLPAADDCAKRLKEKLDNLE